MWQRTHKVYVMLIMTRKLRKKAKGGRDNERYNYCSCIDCYGLVSSFHFGTNRKEHYSPQS